MNFRYWLNLLGFVSLLVFSGLFRKSLIPDHQVVISVTTTANPFLFGQKMSINDAKPSDFASIDGISIRTARRIVDYLSRHPDATIKDLDAVSGIGVKTLDKLGEFFF